MHLVAALILTSARLSPRGPAMHPKDVGPYSTLSDTPQLTLGYITNLSKPQFLGL